MNLKNRIMVYRRIYEKDNNRANSTFIDGRKNILVETNSKDNLIKCARSDKNAYKTYKDLLKRDYILTGHNGTESFLCKREFIIELWQRKDLKNYESLFYTIENPIDRKLNEQNTKKQLLVLFTCMPNLEKYDNSLMTDRMFHPFFSKISVNLIKNTYIMRIMDLNCSHYIDTINNSEMENQIKHSIEEVRNQLLLDKKDVVLYGASKGGTGALYHGLKLGYSFLAVDPIISISEYNKTDAHFLKDLRVEDLTDILNYYIDKKSSCEKYIIASENVTFNYSKVKGLKNEELTILNMKDNHIKTHPDVSLNSIPEQLAILNKLLRGGGDY